MDAMRAMLDELMGKERNLPPEARTKIHRKFSDREICKHALCGLCPYGLFKNTRSDLGSCKFEFHEEQIGWEEVQAQWDALSEKEKEKYGYELDLLLLLEQLVREMDRKIDRQRERAEKESALREPNANDRMRLDALLAQQKQALNDSERLAEAGEIDASLAATQAAEAFKRQHDDLLRKATQPERIMSVCEVCGVFINSTDNEQRRLDHLQGKQYLGWKAIREKLAEMQEAWKDKPREKPARSRSRSRSRSRDRSRERRRRRSRSRSRDRHHRSSRHRSRSRDRERRSHRSRDRERDRDYDYDYDRRRY